MSRRKKKSNFGKIVKLIIVLIVVFIVVVIASMAISKQITNKDKQPAENKVTNEQIAQNVVEDNKIAKIEEGTDYIYEKDKYEVNESYSPEMPDDKYTTTIQLPFINLDSEDAKRLNSKFQDEFEKAKKSVKKGEDGYGLELKELNYTASIIEDKLISLAVESGELYVPGHASLPATIYNIDLETGKLISNDVVVEKLGLTMEDLEKQIEKAMREFYDEAKAEAEDDPMISNEVLEYYASVEDLIKAAKTNYANTKLYVIDDKTIAMELNYKNVESLKTWTKIELD